MPTSSVYRDAAFIRRKINSSCLKPAGPVFQFSLCILISYQNIKVKNSGKKKNFLEQLIAIIGHSLVLNNLLVSLG